VSGLPADLAIGLDLAWITPDQSIEISGEGLTFTVTYTEEQAHGDDGRPVPGDTVGEFTLTHPSGRVEHIHVGPGPLAKLYHAEQIGKTIASAISRAKLDRLRKEAGG
jgi:hypothetical protein